MRPKIKICCISSIAEARMAIEHGANAIGLVGPMPSGPGVISDDLIREIAGTVPETIDTFLLTSETKAVDVVLHHRKVNTRTIQLVDKLAAGTHAEIRSELPGVGIVQVVHIVDESSIDEALEAAGIADSVLLDSGNPNLDVKELGGTGRTHNWEISRKIVEQAGKPVYLAGGLHPGNVQHAIETVGPFGIDICTGVRTNGALEPSKLSKVFEQVMRA